MNGIIQVWALDVDKMAKIDRTSNHAIITLPVRKSKQKQQFLIVIFIRLLLFSPLKYEN